MSDIRRAQISEICDAVASMSSYWNGMNQTDLQARGGSTIDQVKHTYISSFHNFSFLEWIYLSGVLIPRCKKRLAMLYPEFCDLPWIVAIADRRAEGGMPHTIGNIIVLHYRFFRIDFTEAQRLNTLIHERIHVYQRLRPNICIPYYASLDFIPYTGAVSPQLASIRRSNPDIVGRYVISDGRGILNNIENNMIMKLYDSPYGDNSMPSSLSRATTWLINPLTMEGIKFEGVKKYFIPEYVRDDEHPQEIMAAMIAYSAFPC